MDILQIYKCRYCGFIFRKIKTYSSLEKEVKELFENPSYELHYNCPGIIHGPHKDEFFGIGELVAIAEIKEEANGQI